jgi:hypothetical protein
MEAPINEVRLPMMIPTSLRNPSIAGQRHLAGMDSCDVSRGIDRLPSLRRSLAS